MNRSQNFGIFKDIHFKNPELKKVLTTADPMRNKFYNTLDEISNGRLFADTFGGILKYNTTARCWYYFDGCVWKMDEGNVIVEKTAQRFARCLNIYVAENISESPNEHEKQYRKFICRLGARATRLKMIDDARSLTCCKTTDFDANGDLFNCRNGELNLKTFVFTPHAAADMLSKCSGAYYDPQAVSDDWIKFMHEIMQGDESKIEYLQRLFGYAMTNENEQEEMYFCYGATTRNGKSTCLETIGYMFGDYAMNISPESLEQRKQNSRNASGDIARLDGCRFLHCSEPPKRMRFNVELVKTLLGRDKITARNLYEREFEFIPIFKLFINTNSLPIVLDDTLFTSQRVKVITFDRHFMPNEQDKGLKDRLKKKENISGLLNWCIEGLKNYRKHGTTPPECVLMATEAYQRDSDKIGNFVLECFEDAPDAVISVKAVYDVYRQWCQANGYGVEGKMNFVQELKNKSLWCASGTVDGHTVKNVVKGYRVEMPFQSVDDYDGTVPDGFGI